MRRLLSWPSWSPAFLRLPLDHVLARGRARVATTWLGPISGSGHPPILAEIAVAP